MATFTEQTKNTSSFAGQSRVLTGAENFIFEDGSNFIFEDGDNFVFALGSEVSWAEQSKN